jgi:phospholipid/cholesterol/gamma-HCH transport system substrate-binding protein
MKKDWRERELTMEIVVGAFMVMIFFGLGYFTIILSKEAIFRQKTEIQISFPDVMGLREGDNVVVRGMPVGKVKSLMLVDKDQETGEACSGVCVTLSLDDPLVMHEGYSARILSTSLLGGRQLQIDTGPTEAPVLEGNVFSGSRPYDLMEDAAEIVNAAREEIIEGGVFEKISNVADQVDQIVTRVNAGEGLLGKVLSDDETIYRDLQASAASLRELMDRLKNGEGAVGKLLSGDATVYNDLAKTAKSAREIAEKLNRGQGTLGRFINDDSMYNEIESTVGEVRAAVDDFRETAPVTTFSSIFFGAF